MRRKPRGAVLTFNDPLRGGDLGLGSSTVVRGAVINRHFDFSSDLTVT